MMQVAQIIALEDSIKDLGCQAEFLRDSLAGYSQLKVLQGDYDRKKHNLSL